MRTKNIAYSLFLVISALTISACGDDGGAGPDAAGSGGDGGNNPGIDGGNNPGGDGGNNPGIDGGTQPVCGDTECNNCQDDDGDGFTDGADVHCISAADDDESSFATGIPGDNVDSAQPDCFFDGDSGAGNDGCDIDACCLLGTCAPGTDCTVSQMCIDFCAPLVPVGCDCFGCCTLCEGDTCKDILTFPDSTPDWDCNDLSNINDPLKCPECTKIAGCDTACDTGDGDCILCPGQSPDELPPECNMQNECPDGRQVCSATVACPTLQYCSNGCCIDIVIE
jgi:hypothetical protein